MGFEVSTCSSLKPACPVVHQHEKGRGNITSFWILPITDASL